jgi:hypothetical protein
MDTSLFYDFRREIVDYAASRLNRVLDARRFYVRVQDYDPSRFAAALAFIDETTSPPLRLRVYLQLGQRIGIVPGSFRLYEDPDHPPSPDDEVYVLDAVVSKTLLNMWLLIQQDLQEFDQNNYILVDPMTPLITHDGAYIAYA